MAATDQTGGQTADLDWTEGVVPVSRRFGDPYFSLQGGLAETRHVFLAGNGLPQRFRAGFRIAELGLGSGLNLLASLICWRAAGVPGVLRYTAFEAYPMEAGDMARALSAFPEINGMADPVREQWAAGQRLIRLPDLEAEIVLGDARDTLPRWAGRADAWFLDGFAPARNPELWGEALLAAVAAHTAPGGSFATYAAAGFVRRGREGAGFRVERSPGFGRKRHMTSGLLAA
jgi:tRNA U34 5-methylaminomethyl-2-thiouridine-forming methyltransferase MnmC